MSTGIVLPSILTIATSTSEKLIFGSNKLNGSNAVQAPSIQSWVPPQYSKPAVTILTVPAGTNTSTGQASSSDVNYVFDAVFKVVHKRESVKTSHPVLTGASITDHMYTKASVVTLEIGMSDAMVAFKDGIWVGSSTKSISAWQILKSLQINKTLLNLTTRLDTYYNMLIISDTGSDDYRTKTSLRATIVLEELLSAGISSTSSVSTRPQTTGSTSSGVVQSTSPNSAQTQQYVIPSTQYPNVTTYPTIPGAGNVSSNSLSQLK